MNKVRCGFIKVKAEPASALLQSRCGSPGLTRDQLDSAAEVSTYSRMKRKKSSCRFIFVTTLHGSRKNEVVYFTDYCN